MTPEIHEDDENYRLPADVYEKFRRYHPEGVWGEPAIDRADSQ
jgi:hypothetical protein